MRESFQQERGWDLKESEMSFPDKTVDLKTKPVQFRCKGNREEVRNGAREVGRSPIVESL